MEDSFYDETMDMPTPCEHCHNIFDLNDGYGSEKWHPNIIICEKCHYEEEEEIEEDEYYETLNIELGNALYGINEKKGAWQRLDKENQALIIQLVSERFPLIDKKDPIFEILFREDKTWCAHDYQLTDMMREMVLRYNTFFALFNVR